MLTLVIGRGGCGKSEYLYKTAVETARGGVERQLFLVPETHSHEAERQLCTMGGDGISLSCEVLTFRRLANRVFSQEGGLAARILDEGGRLLLMQNAFSQVRASLRYYVGAASSALLEGFLQMIDEFKSCCLDGVALSGLLPEMDDTLRAKLHDLLLLQAAYDSLCGTRFQDPRDEMTRLADAARTSDWFRGRRIYIDGFTGFTPQEYGVLAAMAGSEVMAALTCGDSLAEGDELFEKSRVTAARLTRIIGDGEAAIISLPVRKRPADLAHLESRLFSYAAASPYPEAPRHIQLTAAPGIFAECQLAAAKIRRLLREGLRYRDILILSGNFEDYRLSLESALERFDIPYYIAQKTDLRSKSVTALILRAVGIAVSGFRHDDIFTYLKTGLSGISREDIDLLENYALLWRIKPFQWVSRTPWGMNPDGFAAPVTEESAAMLEKLNSLRSAVATPLLRLRDVLRRETATRVKIRAVYDFAMEIGLPASIQARMEALNAAGELGQADEYRQLWNIFCRCLDSFIDVSGDSVLTGREFENLFSLVLSRYDIGTIPPAIDRVSCGELARLRITGAKAVFILGVEDGAFPPAGNPGSLLTDMERDTLTAYDIELAYTAQTRDADGLYDVYKALTKPSHGLFLSYPGVDANGHPLRPAYIIRRLCSLFPELTIRRSEQDDSYLLEAPKTALDYAASHGEPAAARIREALAALPNPPPALYLPEVESLLPENTLSPENARSLYGQNLRLSSTRIDAFHNCRFAYFSRYGLSLKPRREAAFDAPQRGLFIHFVLEGTVRQVQAAGGFAACTRAQVRDFAEACVLEYIKRDIPDFSEKSARFKYLFGRIQKSLHVLIDNLYDEFSKSSFFPLDFELQFGEELPPVQVETGDGYASLRGVVDRIDGWVKNGVLYLRVVDYKSGVKSFSYGEILNGLGMQMPIYLFALQQEARRYLSMHPELAADAIVPAGLLYTPARANILTATHNLADELLQKELDADLRRSGIILDDPEVIDAMEQGIEKDGQFIPVHLTKTGGHTASSSVANGEQFALLEYHVKRMLRLTAELMEQGHIDARPTVSHGIQSCAYCDYRSVCYFHDERNAARIQYIPNMNAARFYDIVKEGEAHGSELDS